jgi:hypothetical protein
MSHSVLNSASQQREVHKSSSSSPNHDFFQMIFESADMVSAFWQPLLKSVGRWQLEIAGLSMKQSQATLRLTHDFARCTTPADVASANLRYWDSLTSEIAQSSHRIAASVQRAAEVPSRVEIVNLPSRSGRDMIVLLGANRTDDRRSALKVA